jgi:hypothetical protein
VKTEAPEAAGVLAAPLGGVRRDEALDGGREAEPVKGRRKAGASGQGPRRKPLTTVAKAPLRVAMDRALAELGRVAGLRRLGLSAALGALWVLGGCGGGVSGEIGQACANSGRAAANRQLCSCIQGVANQSLSAADQRRAARFFSDPDRAQDVRLSDTAQDDAFWERWRAFASRAEAVCS